jgi:two-component system OmpR family response regulator
MILRKILLVDDEADIRLIAEISLSSLGGWEVLQAGSGREALELAARERPDLILLDVMMPGMDGMTTLQKLREQEHGATTPVIFMTARVQKAEIDRLLALGVRGLIPKPFDPMTLPEEIRAILGS